MALCWCIDDLIVWGIDGTIGEHSLCAFTAAHGRKITSLKFVSTTSARVVCQNCSSNLTLLHQVLTKGVCQVLQYAQPQNKTVSLGSTTTMLQSLRFHSDFDSSGF
eukprot:2352644-Amphidinium_carterae.1